MSLSRINLNNFGIVSGQLIRDPKVISHDDYDVYVYVVVSRRFYDSKEGKALVDYTSLFQRVYKDQNPNLKKGDNVSFIYTNISYHSSKTGNYRETKWITGLNQENQNILNTVKMLNS